MDLILYYKVYGYGINKEAVLRYIKYFKFCYLSYIIKDYVQGAKFKIGNKKKAFIIKIN